MTGVSWFGRDPAAVVAQAVSLLIAVVMLFPLVEAVSAALIAVIIAVGGVVVSFKVAKDGQLAVLVGLGRAGIALGVVLGLPWSETYQALVIVAMEQVFAFFVRDRVVAPITVDGQRVRTGPVLEEHAA